MISAEDVKGFWQRHECYLHTFDQKLNYDGGSAAFTVGKTVTGEDSEATGIIKSKSGTVASGYLVLSNVSGTFQNNETITDDGTPAGAAVVNGTNSDYVDSYGKRSQTASGTATKCQFYNKQAPPGDLEYGWSGQFPAVQLPADTVLLNPGDHGGAIQRLNSTESGFNHTYEIQWPPISYPDDLGGVDHITCGLKAVT